MQNLGHSHRRGQGAAQLEMGFSAVGAVAVDERGIATVQTRVNGDIEKLYVRAQYDPL